MSGNRRLRIALPWLHDAIVEARTEGTMPPMSAWCWLAGRGDAMEAPAGDFRDWLLGAVDASAAAELERWPAGPCLAAAAGAGPDATPGWAVAQPVHLAAGLDHLRLAPLADACPSPVEVEQLAGTLRAHFVRDEFDLVGHLEGAWLVRCPRRLQCQTADPAALVGRNIHDHMPAGPDGAHVRSLMNEVQMVLHDHPVNQRRASTRALPINALWLWGFGTFTAPPPPLFATSPWRLQSDDLWLRAFWRTHGGKERALGEAGEAAETNALVAMLQPPTTDAGEALAEVDSSLFSRLRHAVQGGDPRSLEVHDGRRVHALDLRSRYRIWRRPAVASSL